MKKNKLLKVLLFSLLVVVIATWFIPSTSINDMKVVAGEYNRVGIFKLSSFFMVVLENFLPVTIYLLAVGGFYGVLYKVSAYKKLVKNIAGGFKGREWIFFIVVGLILALGASMAGLSIVLLILVPLITSVILGMGYNKITSAILIVGSLLAGTMGTMFSSKTLDGLMRTLSVTNQSEFLKGDLLVKAIIFVVTLGLVIGATILHAKNNKEEPVLLETDEKKKRLWPLVVIFDLLIIVLALGFVSWEVFNVNLFNDLVNNIVSPTGSTFTKGILGGFNALLGLSSNPETIELTSFGNWTLIEASVSVLVATFVIALAYKVKFDDYLDGFLAGCKKAIKPAFLILIPYLILVVASSTGITNGILGGIMELGKGVKVVPMSLVSMGYSILNVEAFYSSYFAQTYIISTGISGTMGSLSANEVNLIALLWNSMYALIMLVAPTSVILISVLSYLEISYKEWLKHIWKLFIALYIALVLILYLYN